MEAIKPDPSLNLKTALQEITSRKPKVLGALKSWGGAGGGASAGELCIEEGAWGLHVTPSFPRLGPIFKYPEHGSMAGVGPGWWAGPCKDVLSACGLRLWAGGVSPGPGASVGPNCSSSPGQRPAPLCGAGGSEEPSRKVGRGEVSGAGGGALGRVSFPEAPGVDGARRGAGVCRGPWTGAPHCPAEGLLCGGRPTIRPVC